MWTLVVPRALNRHFLGSHGTAQDPHILGDLKTLRDDVDGADEINVADLCSE